MHCSKEMGYAWDVSDMHRCVWLVCCEKMAMYYNGNTSVIHVPYIYDIQDLFGNIGVFTRNLQSVPHCMACRLC